MKWAVTFCAKVSIVIMAIIGVSALVDGGEEARKELIVDKIIVRDKTGEVTITGQGVWVTPRGKNLPTACMYISGDVPVVAVHGKRLRVASPAALSVSAEGDGVVQILPVSLNPEIAPEDK